MKTIKKATQTLPILLVFILLSSFNGLIAQNATGTLKGEIIDASNGDPLPFANVTLFKSNTQVSGTTTDFDGKYIFTNIKPGKYKIQVAYVGYKLEKIENIIVSAGKNTVKNITLSASAENLEEFTIITNEIPLISKDEVSSETTITVQDIKNMPSRSVASISSKRKYRKQKNRNKSYGYLSAPIESRRDNFNTEGYAHNPENNFKMAKATPLSTFSIDVDAASYSNMRRFINSGQNPPIDAVRIEEMINYFNYDYPQPKDEAPFSITTEMSDCPWNTKHKLVHIGIQGEKIEMENLPSSNIVFLLDVSGSMSSPNKLPLLKKSFGLLIKNLTENDKVAIVVYAGAAGLVLESTPGNEKEKIMNALNNLNAGGSTAGGAGIKLAYKVAIENFIKEGNNRVILATDGDFNIGASSDGEMTRLIEKKRESGVFLTCLGFGMGNYKDSKMETLADKGNGNYAYIDNILEAKKVLVTEMGGTMHTIAKDVKIQVEFNPNKIASYKLIGYENRLLNDEDFNDDTKDAGELGSGHTVTALYEVVLKGSSEEIASVDPLRYQKNEIEKTSNNNEILTVKFRYKAPQGKKSKLIVRHLKGKLVPFAKSSNNFKFSAAVAEFGLLLRNSKHKVNASYTQVIKLAKSSKGKDDNGYRAEFIRLVEMSEMQASALLIEK
ncbi:MAG: von Willebrand factor type A domain-containing protein [Flavobacteriales bacterium]|nr:von Willebrand factor type A domain-containing protein [Flavobacteriales bacterium]